MSEDLESHYNKNSDFLKLSDGEIFKGLYIGYEPITTKWGKGYRFILERENGNRIKWDRGSSKNMIDQMKVFKKGDTIKIQKNVVIENGEKKNRYEVTSEAPF